MTWLLTLRALPRWIWPALGGAALIIAALIWHRSALTDARNAGRAEQAQIDAAAFTEAQRLATEAQQAAIDRARANNAKTNQEITDALIQSRDDLSSRYDDLRMRWAKAKADSGSAREGGAVAAAETACRVDDTQARGLVDIEVAIAASQAADENAAVINAWIAWYQGIAEGWPR